MDLDGHTILIVEDEFLIAMDLEDSIEDAGADVIGPADTNQKALDLLTSQKVSAAILDINLGREYSKPVAVKLAAENIPFVYHSGQSALKELAQWPKAPILNKPSTPSAVIAKLSDILGLPK